MAAVREAPGRKRATMFAAKAAAARSIQDENQRMRDEWKAEQKRMRDEAEKRRKEAGKGSLSSMIGRGLGMAAGVAMNSFLPGSGFIAAPLLGQFGGMLGRGIGGGGWDAQPTDQMLMNMAMQAGMNYMMGGYGKTAGAGGNAAGQAAAATYQPGIIAGQAAPTDAGFAPIAPDYTPSANMPGPWLPGPHNNPSW